MIGSKHMLEISAAILLYLAGNLVFIDIKITTYQAINVSLDSTNITYLTLTIQS